MKFTGWQGNLAALFTGALIPFSLAPYNIWALGILSTGILSMLLQDLNGKRAFFRSYFFGLGLFGMGASWVYVAINDFGMTDTFLAGILTSIFVGGLALVFAFPFYLFRRFFPTNFFTNTLGFSAIWVLGEWLRSWFLTGFPWLYIGYAHTETSLSGFAPIFGIFGISFFVALAGSSFVASGQLLRQERNGHCAAVIVLICLIFAFGRHYTTKDWLGEENTESKTLDVAVVQPNIPMEVKWNPLFADDILDTLREETSEHWDKDLIIWPEAAIPMLYHDAQSFLQEMHEQASANNTGIILGVLFDNQENQRIYNSIIGIGQAEGIYFKQRLVPFGEYVPLEKILRGLIAFFDLNNSFIALGPKDQEILSIGRDKIAPSICYEIVYPDLVAKLAKDAGLLITISNDAWFGTSIGPMQHFQMAQMRAIENQRHVLRSTNTGVSGIIDPKGRTVAIAPQFSRDSIAYPEITLRYGTTPFARFGSLPIIVFCFITLFVLVAFNFRKTTNQPTV